MHVCIGEYLIKRVITRTVTGTFNPFVLLP